MHSSSSRPTAVGGYLSGEGVFTMGVSAQGGVSAQDKVSAQGECLPMGVCLPEGGVYKGSWGCLPQCIAGIHTPTTPVNGMTTDACENITLPELCCGR